MTRVAFCNLGCKVNQFDVAAMQAEMLATGDRCRIVPFEEEADVYVVNTCSVTGKSDYEARQWVRRAIRRNRHARVVVTGCYAQTHPEEVAKIKGVSLILGNQEKLHLSNHLNQYERLSCTRPSQGEDAGPLADPLPETGPVIAVGDIRKEASTLEQRPISRFPFKTRAFFKVQDGCNSRCSFCIIPMSRGRSRSLPIEDALDQAILFDKQGYQEIILTGIHLGSYGRDFSSKISLAHLLREILKKTKVPRIRISSLEPREVTPEFLETVQESDRICKHLHIPLQSGDDEILRVMNRNYSSGYYENLILSIVEKFGPNLGLGADVMAGFPGEGESQFQNTYNLVAKLPFTYLHVFSYSPRAGTEAYKLKETLNGAIKKRRSEQLRTLSNEKNKLFLNRWIGRSVRVLLEEYGLPEEGIYAGYSDHYLHILVEPGTYDLPLHPNQLVEARVNGSIKEVGSSQLGVATLLSPGKPVASVR